MIRYKILINNVFTLIRLKDWSKNIIIFLPLIFSGNLQNNNLYFDLFITFMLFSLTSSLIYIINDIIDINDDKKHSLKIHKKPLASGKLSIKFALSLILIIFIILSLGFIKYQIVYIHLILYALINCAYSFFIKKIPILDVVLISIGYLIRLDVGSVVINVKTSIFLAGTIFFLACFIIFIKRFIELKNEFKTKRSKYFYSKKNLKIVIILSSILFFLTLILFTLIVDIRLLISIPLLILIFIRYYKSSIYYNLGEFPLDLIIRDKIILLTSSVVIVYTIYLYY